MLTGTCHCGAIDWTFTGDPGSATACNCTACRRYGALWIYGWEGEGITLNGHTRTYKRADGGHLKFHYCANCGNVAAWRTTRPDGEGRYRMAVNIRLVNDPAAVMALPIDHFDGHDSFDDLPRDGKTVADLWA